MFVHKADWTMRPISFQDFKFLLGDFEDGEKVTVTVESFVRKKELEQMGLLHVYINYIHEYTGEDQKEIKIDLKERYGVRNENGSLKSTARYTSKEMAKLIEGTYIHMTQFLGLNIPNPDEQRTKNMK